MLKVQIGEYTVNLAVTDDKHDYDVTEDFLAELSRIYNAACIHYGVNNWNDLADEAAEKCDDIDDFLNDRGFYN